MTVGRESYQQVDSEKIITTRYLEEIHRSKGLSNINIYSIAGAMAAQ